MEEGLAHCTGRRGGRRDGRRARGGLTDFTARQGISFSLLSSSREESAYLVTVRTTPSAPVATTVARLTAPAKCPHQPPPLPPPKKELTTRSSLKSPRRSTSSGIERSRRARGSRVERAPDRRTCRLPCSSGKTSRRVECTCYGGCGVSESASNGWVREGLVGA